MKADKDPQPEGHTIKQVRQIQKQEIAILVKRALRKSMDKLVKWLMGLPDSYLFFILFIRSVNKYLLSQGELKAQENWHFLKTALIAV